MISYRFTRRLLILIAALTTLSCATQTLIPAADLENGSWLAKYVVPPGDEFAGHTMGDYAVAWWQWSLSFSKEESPMRDVAGKNCSLGQAGDVWFLGGAYGGRKVRRTCTIPEGKALFFP